MNFTFTVYNETHFDLALKCKAAEICIPIEGLSKEGGVSVDEALKLENKANQKGLSIVFICDRLIEERSFSTFCEQIKPLLHKTLVISDIGAAKWLKEQKKSFHLSLEIGSANDDSVLGWINYFEPFCKRVVLNYQIEARELHPLISKISCESEILGLGDILMYYSPRELLSFTDQQQKEVSIQSEDAGPSEFKFLQSESGSVMYYSKGFSLLSYISEFTKSSLTSMRINPRFFDQEMCKTLLASFEDQNFNDLKKNWPKPLLHGYYGSNKSDGLFVHLPKRKKDENFEIAAEVIDFDENSILIRAMNSIPLGAELRAIDTKKREFIWNVNNLVDLEQKSLEILKKNETGLIKRIRTLTTGSFIYFN
jgi:U32 family peptidase